MSRDGHLSWPVLWLADSAASIFRFLQPPCAPCRSRPRPRVECGSLRGFREARAGVDGHVLCSSSEARSTVHHDSPSRTRTAGSNEPAPQPQADERRARGRAGRHAECRRWGRRRGRPGHRYRRHRGGRRAVVATPPAGTPTRIAAQAGRVDGGRAREPGCPDRSARSGLAAPARRRRPRTRGEPRVPRSARRRIASAITDPAVARNARADYHTRTPGEVASQKMTPACAYCCSA